MFINKLVFAWREFLQDRGVDRASVLAYYSIFSIFSFLVLGAYLFSKIYIKTEGEILHSFFFTREFFLNYSGSFFERARLTAEELGSLSLLSAVIFFILGYLMLKKLVQFINEMFATEVQQGFLIVRLKEFLLLIMVIAMLFFTMIFDALLTFINSNIYQKTIFRDYINPDFVRFVDNFFLNYIMPFLVAIFFFFVLFKFVPELTVRKRSALKSALVCTVLWEIIKRIYSYYLINFSLFGKVNNNIISLIVFGFWMELAMIIVLYGAKLTWIFEQER